MHDNADRVNRWTVWWWPTGFDPQHDIPVPHARDYPSLAEAVTAAYRGVQAGTVEWVKVFGPSGGENDIRARWDASRGDEWTDLSREAARMLLILTTPAATPA